mmetsp:Transcript_159896/g.509113  ORF Transcript_159896/g.509113 Transcript_159896/m.509113 type:complete len:121 (-) Transcript_159896:326-688(-)
MGSLGYGNPTLFSSEVGICWHRCRIVAASSKANAYRTSGDSYETPEQDVDGHVDVGMSWLSLLVGHVLAVVVAGHGLRPCLQLYFGPGSAATVIVAVAMAMTLTVAVVEVASVMDVDCKE